MKKLGIILDSFSGINKTKANNLGFEFVSQTIIIDDIIYKDGIDIVLEKDSHLIKNATNIKSSMPGIGIVVEKMQKMIKKYENVIYLPINKGMSSTYSIGVGIAKEFANVHVISTKLIGSAIPDVATKAIHLANQGKGINEIIDFINEVSKNSFSYIIPKDVSGLIKSGRLSGSKKFIMEKARLIPKLCLTNEGLKIEAIKRNMSKLIKSTISKIVEKIGKNNISNYNWEIISSSDRITSKMGIDAMKLNGIQKISNIYGSVIVIAYTGIGAIAINVWNKLKIL